MTLKKKQFLPLPTDDIWHAAKWSVYEHDTQSLVF